MNLPTVSYDNLKVKCFSVLAIMFIAACSSGGGESNPKLSGNNITQTVDINEVVGTLANDGTWQLEEKLFISGGEGSRTQSNQKDRVTIVVGDEIFDNSNGVYSGGRINISLTLSGDGLYAVTDLNNFTAAASSGAKAASISVTAGTLLNNETQWASTATSGSVLVSVNSEGRYFVSTTEPLILTRILDVGTGVPGSPDQVLFRMRSINGVVIQ